MAGAAREWAHPSASLGQLVSPPVLAAMVIGFLAALAVDGAAIVVRFARSTGEERLQLKWFTAAAVLVTTFIAVILTGSNSVAAAILLNLALVCLDVAITVAVLKYRLYEIDRIISRTLAYTIVTGVLVGLYAGLVLLATRVLSFSSPVAVAASTLAAAALFSPLRRAGAAGRGPQVQPGPLLSLSRMACRSIRAATLVSISSPLSRLHDASTARAYPEVCKSPGTRSGCHQRISVARSSISTQSRNHGGCGPFHLREPR